MKIEDNLKPWKEEKKARKGYVITGKLLEEKREEECLRSLNKVEKEGEVMGRFQNIPEATQRRTRLAKYYVRFEDPEKHKVHRLVVNRDPKFTNFVEYFTSRPDIADDCFLRASRCIPLEFNVSSDLGAQLLKIQLFWNVSGLLVKLFVWQQFYLGCDIKKGWAVFLDVISIHHDPENFRDPEKFDPSRFDAPIKPFGYLGSGFRMCPRINLDLAKLELCIFVHHLVCRYKFCHPSKWKMYWSMHLKVDALGDKAQGYDNTHLIHPANLKAASFSSVW
ncbi:hypothetical protein AgCh_005274 [Apium graveolens]